jgi:ATP sulfurylase
MSEQFPYKTKEDKEKNVKFYSVDSTRIAKHMWIAQGFYSVLSQRLPKEYATQLVQPYSVETKMVFPLTMPVIKNA